MAEAGVGQPRWSLTTRKPSPRTARARMLRTKFVPCRPKIHEQRRMMWRSLSVRTAISPSSFDWP